MRETELIATGYMDRAINSLGMTLASVNSAGVFISFADELSMWNYRTIVVVGLGTQGLLLKYQFRGLS